LKEERLDLKALLTLEYWPEDREWVAPVWDTVLASVERGREIADPTIGPLDN
jgi:hypothetical protein